MDLLPLSARRLAPVAAALCALTIAPTAKAAFPGTNGSIAFDRGGSILTSTGATVSETGYDFAPAVSPDGSQVAYAVNRDIWVSDADGSDARQVTTDSRFNRDPAWTPDGKRIVYSGGTDAGRPDLFSIPVKGGTAVNLTNTVDHEEYDPAVSPDGTRMAYTRTGCETPYGGGTCVYVMSASGAGQTNLTAEDSVEGCDKQPGYYFDGASKQPTWSPDGGKIAFVGPLLCSVSTIGSDIWVMGADGAGKVNLTHDDGTNDVEPAFSPDGMQIAFARNSHSGPTNVYTIAGTAITQVTNGGDDRNPDWGVAPKHCVVPKLKKAKLADAKADLVLMGCRVGKVSRKKTKAAKGTVVSQEEKAGKRLKPGTKIDLVVDK